VSCVFGGLARTVNGFDLVDARRVACAPVRSVIGRIERGERGVWNCSRGIHAVFVLRRQAAEAHRRHRPAAQLVVAAVREGGQLVEEVVGVLVSHDWDEPVFGGGGDGLRADEFPPRSQAYDWCS